MVMGYLRRILSVTTIKAESLSLFGRLEGLGPGSSAAVNRGKQTANLERNGGFSKKQTIYIGWVLLKWTNQADQSS